MKYLFLTTFLLIISCKNKSADLGIPAVIKRSSRTVVDWDKFEKGVGKTIQRIEKSNPDDRKGYLVELIGYCDKVDGGIAEVYCNFTYEYVEEKPKDFYSVLTENDSLLIKSWAEKSSSEIALVGDNSVGIDSVLKVTVDNHLMKRKDLSDTEIKLDELYLKSLEESLREK